MKAFQEHGRGPQVGLKGLRHSNGWIFGTMLFSAIISLIAAFVLSKDAIELAANPNATFSCDINAVLSCGTVAKSWQAELFGFPNSFLGLMTEPVVITIAVLGLCYPRFPRWFMCTAQVVYLLGLSFAYWLFFQSYTSIGALCPFCLLITLGTTLVFFTLLHYNVREDNLFLPTVAQAKAEAAVRVGADLVLAALCLMTIITLIAVKYGPYLLR